MAKQIISKSVNISLLYSVYLCINCVENWKYLVLYYHTVFCSPTVKVNNDFALLWKRIHFCCSLPHTRSNNYKLDTVHCRGSLSDLSKNFSQPWWILVEARVTQKLCSPFVEIVVEHRSCRMKKEHNIIYIIII